MWRGDKVIGLPTAGIDRRGGLVDKEHEPFAATVLPRPKAQFDLAILDSQQTRALDPGCNVRIELALKGHCQACPMENLHTATEFGRVEQVPVPTAPLGATERAGVEWEVGRQCGGKRRGNRPGRGRSVGGNSVHGLS